MYQQVRASTHSFAHSTPFYQLASRLQFLFFAVLFFFFSLTGLAIVSCCLLSLSVRVVGRIDSREAVVTVFFCLFVFFSFLSIRGSNRYSVSKFPLSGLFLLVLLPFFHSLLCLHVSAFLSCFSPSLFLFLRSLVKLLFFCYRYLRAYLGLNNFPGGVL